MRAPVFFEPDKPTEPKLVSETLAALVVVQVRSTASPLLIVLAAGVSVQVGAGITGGIHETNTLVVQFELPSAVLATRV